MKTAFTLLLLSLPLIGHSASLKLLTYEDDITNVSIRDDRRPSFLISSTHLTRLDDVKIPENSALEFETTRLKTQPDGSQKETKLVLASIKLPADTESLILFFVPNGADRYTILTIPDFPDETTNTIRVFNATKRGMAVGWNFGNYAAAIKPGSFVERNYGSAQTLVLLIGTQNSNGTYQGVFSRKVRTIQGGRLLGILRDEKVPDAPGLREATFSLIRDVLPSPREPLPSS